MNHTFERLRNRFCPDSFNMTIRERLYSDQQMEYEPVGEFIRRFRGAARILGLEGAQLLAQFMVSLKPSLKEDMVLFNPATMSAAIERARAKEAAQRDSLPPVAKKPPPSRPSEQRT